MAITFVCEVKTYRLPNVAQNNYVLLTVEIFVANDFHIKFEPVLLHTAGED